MRRAVIVTVLIIAGSSRSEQFDYYTYPVLSKAVADGTLKEVKELTADQIADASGALPDSTSTFLVVLTNDKRLARMLVQPARQKVGDRQVPMLLIDKYLTFKGTTERAVQAAGQGVQLYPGLRFSLDIGQVVPESVGGDLIVVASDQDHWTLKPIGSTRLFVVTAPIPGVVPKKAPRLIVGEAFEPRFFAGKYKLQIDGRRSGVLRLEVHDSGEITGTFTSDKDGREYEVTGKTGSPKHQVSLTIRFPASMETLNGYMFTGDGRVIAGFSKLLDRESAFYAERLEE